MSQFSETRMYTTASVLLVLALLYSALKEASLDPPEEARTAFKASKWGPHMWISLHIMAMNMPRDFGSATRAFERYLFDLVQLLPCATCRKEFRSVLRVVPPQPFLRKGRVGAVALIYTYHALVSKQKGGVFLEKEAALMRDYAAPSVDTDLQIRELQHDTLDRGIMAMVFAAGTKWSEHQKSEHQ